MSQLALIEESRYERDSNSRQRSDPVMSELPAFTGVSHRLGY
jgi:hypothetical protein